MVPIAMPFVRQNVIPDKLPAPKKMIIGLAVQWLMDAFLVNTHVL